MGCLPAARDDGGGFEDGGCRAVGIGLGAETGGGEFPTAATLGVSGRSRPAPSAFAGCCGCFFFFFGFARPRIFRSPFDSECTSVGYNFARRRFS